MYLYLKETPDGLKYLGYTARNDVYEYKGSGKYWLRHIKKHNIQADEIATDILLESDDKNEIKFWGIYYSNLWELTPSGCTLLA